MALAGAVHRRAGGPQALWPGCGRCEPHSPVEGERLGDRGGLGQ